MRDDQVRRYARHVLLPDVGGLGQTALLVASARIDVRGVDGPTDATMIAAMYLAAGGTGTLVLHGANSAQLATLTAHGPDTHLVTSSVEAQPLALEHAPASSSSNEVVLPPKPAWWPAAEGDAVALAYWRGSLAAAQWMAAVANK